MKVEIIRPATHGDATLRAGDVVDLPKDEARALIARGLAAEAGKKAKPSEPKKEND